LLLDDDSGGSRLKTKHPELLNRISPQEVKTSPIETSALLNLKKFTPDAIQAVPNIQTGRNNTNTINDVKLHYNDVKIHYIGAKIRKFTDTALGITTK